VDVEDYFQANAFDPWVDRAAWDRMPSRVEGNTERLLELLARFGVQGTFFTVGWVATRFPRLVRRIAEAGHEVASHGHWHRRVSSQTPEEFRRELRQSKAVLEDASGQACRGFRAPTFSIRPGGEWALEILAEEGFEYDSSLFPVRRPDYGYPGIPLVPHWIRTGAGDLLELPLAVLPLGRLAVPAAGGGYLRQLPYQLTARAFRHWESAGYSAMFYTHPWEIDPDQPRLRVGLVTRFRHYRGLEKTWPRLERVLGEFRFTSVASRFGTLLGAPAPLPRPVA
jgi:polysaccharide deacetylase family protein (PEP-CTERM system associated)